MSIRRVETREAFLRLTKLANRSFLENELTKAARMAGGEKDRLYAVLFLDVDRFKLVVSAERFIGIARQHRSRRR